MRGPEVISMRAVTKVYPPGLHVLKEVDLTIHRGELVAIVGPSGSGKSTLLHVMGTLDRATTGDVAIAGVDVAGLNDAALARLRAGQLGFVFQQFFLIESMSALDNVAQALLYSGVPASDREDRAALALARVGLAQRMDHHPAQLSGGEQQRVAIARALVTDPKVVFADEPTGNLDSVSGASVMDLLFDLHAEGSTIVVITHDPAIADSCERRVEILDGLIAHDSRPVAMTRE